MSLKIGLLTIGMFFGIFLVLTRKKRLEFIFWTGLSLMFIRRLAFPFINELNISYFIFVFLIFLNPQILLRSKNVKEWRYWYLLLAISILNAIVFTQKSEYFFGTDVLSKAVNWSSKLFIVIIISSSIIEYVKTSNDLKKLRNIFMIHCFIFSFFSIISYLGFNDGIIITGPDLIQDYNRDIIYSDIYGITHSNLIFGFTPFSLIFLPYINIKTWQKFAFILLISLAVFISLKRLAIISLLFTFFYFIYYETKQQKSIYILLYLIPVLIVLSGSIYFQLALRRFNIFFETLSNMNFDSSTETRKDRLILGINIFKESPLIGKGAGYTIFLHNGFVEILANCGVFGILFFKTLLKPIRSIKVTLKNPWALSCILFNLTCFALEAALNRVEIMYYLGLFYGGFVVSQRINLQENFNRKVGHSYLPKTL